MHPIKQKKNAQKWMSNKHQVCACMYLCWCACMCVCVCAEKYSLTGFTSNGYKLTYSLPLRHPAVFWRNHGDHSETNRSSHLELSRKVCRIQSRMCSGFLTQNTNTYIDIYDLCCCLYPYISS